MRSSRSRLIVALSLTLALVAVARASAHRLDEYLQAARIGIDPGAVTVELDLTPGIAVVPKLTAELDADRDGTIDRSETRAYASRVLGDLVVDLDGQPLTLRLAQSAAPPVDALRGGDSPIRITGAATLPAIAAGQHRLTFRNRHRADIGVYLANALVPATDRVVVTDQTRDPDQRDLTIQFVLRSRPAGWWLPLGVALSLATFAGVWWLRR